MRLGISAINGLMKQSARSTQSKAQNIVNRPATYEGKPARRRKRLTESSDGVIPASNMLNSSLLPRE